MASGLVLKGNDERYTQLDLADAPRAVLEAIMVGGSTPEFRHLVGYEFNGINTLKLTALVGARKFIKGFYEGPPLRERGPEPYIQGYNINVKPGPITTPHLAKPSDEHPKRLFFYRVHGVVPGAAWSRYGQSLLLDYGLGGGLTISTPLRDYLVQVYPDNPDLFLGKAYYSLFGLALPLSYFVLQRRAAHDYRGPKQLSAG